jgi:adenine-specific DNA-methyltransferase
MKGFVPTPQPIVDLMVGKLFEGRWPEKGDLVLDPGCGKGEFIAGVLRWCAVHGAPIPTVVGVENDPHNWSPAHNRFLGIPQVKIHRPRHGRQFHGSGGSS